MKHLIFIALFVISSALQAVAAGTPDYADQTQSVGLVMSGGGAKGIAHIGVIQALEDNDIPIDYITGTSMGAIVGSLYACGYTPSEMMDIIRSESFANWSTGVIDKRLTYYFLQDDPRPTMINLNPGDSDSTRWSAVLPTSLINPLPMNFAFLELYAPYTAQCQGNFDKLFVPFRSVCSDMTNKRMIVSAGGSLGDAVRASMSFPLVFHPIRRNGALLYDGGIYDNFPVDVMRDTFAPQIMIGVDVASTNSDEPANDMMSQLETMIIQHSDSHLPADQGIKLRLHLERFGLLDFNKADEIYAVGYKKGLEMIDSIKSRIHARIPAQARKLRRDVFKSRTPYLRFDSVSVTGGSQSQNEYVHSLFTRNSDEPFDIDRARDAYYRAITPGKFKNLEPEATFNDSTGMFTLDVRSSLRNNLFFGAGGYLTTSTNSMLFLTGGYKTLSFNSLDLRLNGWLGQSYLAAEANAHIRLLRATPSSMQLKLVAARQKYFNRDRMFFQTSEPTALLRNEYFARLSYGIACGRRGKADISIGYGLIDYRINLPSFSDSETGTDIIRKNMAEARGEYEYNTLNDPWKPTAGTQFKAIAIGAMGQAFITADGGRTGHHRSWLQGELTLNHFMPLSNAISLGVEADIMMSTRKLLPSYLASVTDAPQYNPSVAYSNIFAPEFRAFSYMAAGIVPVWKLNSIFQLRGKADLFMPIRTIHRNEDGSARYSKWFERLRFFGQMEAVATLPFANITFYTHYAGIDSGRWNFGLSFGYFLQAPRFLR